MVRIKRFTNPHGQQQHTAAHSAVVPPATSAKRPLQHDELEEEMAEWLCGSSGRRLFKDDDAGVGDDDADGVRINIWQHNKDQFFVVVAPPLLELSNIETQPI